MMAARPCADAALPTPAFASPQPTSPPSVSTFTMTESNDAMRPKSLVCCRSYGIGTWTQVARTLVIFIGAFSYPADEALSRRHGGRPEGCYTTRRNGCRGPRNGRIAHVEGPESRARRSGRRRPRPASPAHAQTTLTMSSWVSPQHHITAVVLQGWANEAEKVTHGRVKFQMLPKHPSAPPGTFDAVREGLVDLSYVTASYTPARHILPMLAELPGAGETALVNSVAYSRIYWKHFHKVGEYKGVKLLGVFTHGPGQLFTKRPVNGIGDIQGLKIRTGGGGAEAVAKAPGASAFVKPAPESYELLKGGVADGVFFPMESIISFKLDTVLEQATLFPGGMYSSSFGFFMNEDKWNKLPKPDQDAIEKLSGEWIARHAGQSWDEADKKGLEVLKKSGVKIVNADPAFVAEVKKRSAPIIEDWVQKASAKGVDAAKILAEFREELKKVAAGK